MRRLFRTVFFLASFMMCCLIFNCDEVFAATTTTCMKGSANGGVCNICNKSSCSHVNGRSYDNVVYYFYTNEHWKVADADKKKLALSGEVREDNVVLIEVSDSDAFVNSWNSMGTHNGKMCYIRGVVINMHGVAEERSIGDNRGLQMKCECEGSCNGNCKNGCKCDCNCNSRCTCNGVCGVYITEQDMNALTTKPVERLILLTCYGAYQYFADNDNVAKLFSQKVDGEVIAGSAKVYRHEISIGGTETKIYYVYYVAIKEALDEGGYKPSVTYRDGYNWILYKGGSVKKVCSGDCYSINALLDLGKVYEEEE